MKCNTIFSNTMITYCVKKNEGVFTNDYTVFDTKNETSTDEEWL